jgi:chromosome segregation ATPase
MAKIYLFLLVMGLLSGVGYTGYSYYMWSQETIGTLRENNVLLEQATETMQNTIEQITADAAKNEELNRDLTRRLQQSQEHLDKLRGAFARIDLTMEALTNAQGLEDRVNRAVDRLIGNIAEETDPNPSTDDSTDSVQREDTGGEGSSPN